MLQYFSNFHYSSSIWLYAIAPAAPMPLIYTMHTQYVYCNVYFMYVYESKNEFAYGENVLFVSPGLYEATVHWVIKT